MAGVEFTARTTEEAIKKATEYFGLPLSRLKIDVITPSSGGLLARLGLKKAKIIAEPTNGSPEQELAEVMEVVRRPEGRSSAQGPAEDVASLAAEVVRRLVEPLVGPVKVEATARENQVQVEVDCAEAGVLIGRRGQTLEALEYLAMRIVSHKCTRPVQVQLDAGGYRRRKRQALEETAREAARKVRATGKAVVLGPMNAQQRRVVHLTLKDEKGVTTYSRGKGELKRVVVAPK